MALNRSYRKIRKAITAMSRKTDYQQALSCHVTYIMFQQTVNFIVNIICGSYENSLCHTKKLFSDLVIHKLFELIKLRMSTIMSKPNNNLLNMLSSNQDVTIISTDETILTRVVKLFTGKLN